MMKRSHGCRHGHSSQRGNAMLFALLALIIMGLTAATTLQSRRVEMKRAAGVAEATVLEKLRNGLQGAMYDQFNALQQGLPLTKASTSVAVGEEAGHRVWRPTVAQLRDMGYLPEGWTTERSALNDAPYSISLRTIPSGCAPVNCDVEAHVVVMRPFLDDGRGPAVDGVTIGPILTKTGADGGVSLATRPGVISGFNNAWTLPNPVPGQPAGVVALRIGTESAGFNQFVRMGDLRDPVLRGNLSAVGQLEIGGSGVVQGGFSVRQGLSVGGEPTSPCASVDARGVMALGCEGTLSLTALTASGTLTAEGGISTPYANVFRREDPSRISLSDMQLVISGPSGPMLTLGDKTVSSPGVISAEYLNLSSVDDGSDCSVVNSSGQRLAMLNGGGMAICSEGRWAAAVRLAEPGEGCPAHGTQATSRSSGKSLVCRHGAFVAIADLLSDFVLVSTLALQTGSGPSRVNKPLCNSTGLNGEPLIIVTPNNEAVPNAAPNTLSGINRYALDQGDHWTVVVELSSTEAALDGNVVAAVYCYYGGA